MTEKYRSIVQSCEISNKLLDVVRMTSGLWAIVRIFVRIPAVEFPVAFHVFDFLQRKNQENFVVQMI